MNDAWSLAVQIADFRSGNSLPRATPKEALKDIDDAQCERLHNDPAHCIDADKKKGVRAAIGRLSRNVGRAAVGGHILVDWLGNGAETVNVEIAQARANVCLDCDRNQDGHSLLKLTADTVRAIAEQMQVKEHKRLRVEGEENLHVCSVCSCVLPLKIWLRPDILAERTSKETLQELPTWCWLKAEVSTLK